MTFVILMCCHGDIVYSNTLQRDYFLWAFSEQTDVGTKLKSGTPDNLAEAFHGSSQSF
jgi:hypothetical protein